MVTAMVVTGEGWTRFCYFWSFCWYTLPIARLATHSITHLDRELTRPGIFTRFKFLYDHNLGTWWWGSHGSAPLSSGCSVDIGSPSCIELNRLHLGRLYSLHVTCINLVSNKREAVFIPLHIHTYKHHIHSDIFATIYLQFLGRSYAVIFQQYIPPDSNMPYIQCSVCH